MSDLDLELNLPGSSDSQIELLLEMENKCFGSNAWNYKNLQSHFQFHSSAILLENQIRLAYLLFTETEDEVEILRIAVLPEYRRRNLGSFLLNFLFSKNKRILLEVHNKNIDAIKFYESNHFKKIHTRNHYYENNESAYIYEYQAGIFHQES